MKTDDARIENLEIGYPLENLAPLEQILFLDIETTGFTARTSYLYLIGCAYYSEGCWRTRQWFAQSYVEEIQIITAFFEFAASYKYLIHFNGNNFDLPFIQQKCEQLRLPYNFEGFEGLDIYRRVSFYKYFLKLPNCKQKTIEKFLGIRREDAFSGGELIGVYHDYIKMPSEFAEKSLLLHNADDLQGMLQILPILSYYDLFDGKVKARKVQANSYRDINGNRRQELVMTLTLPCTLPVSVSASANYCYFKGGGTQAQLRVPIYEEEMKYFYTNYRDYYYLPAEDVALHRSVASFVDHEHRVNATAATCYTRKYSSYLPQWDVLIEPFFKRDYKSKELFFELTDEIKKNRQAFTSYANHILSMMAATY